MKEDKFFFLAIIVSTIIHLIVFIKLSYSNIHYFNRPVQRLEVVYNGPQKSQKFPQKKKSYKSLQQRQLSRDTEALFKKHEFPTQLVKDSSKFAGKIETHKKSPIKGPALSVKRRVSIPVIKSEKIDNSKYLTYRNRIREGIRERAFSYLQSTNIDFESGEVYVSFILLPDGSLKTIKIVEEKSDADQAIRGISIKSVKENKFPSFPSDLKYPELPFGVVISFEIGE